MICFIQCGVNSGSRQTSRRKKTVNSVCLAVFFSKIYYLYSLLICNSISHDHKMEKSHGENYSSIKLVISVNSWQIGIGVRKSLLCFSANNLYNSTFVSFAWWLFRKCACHMTWDKCKTIGIAFYYVANKQYNF